jgi:ATP-dependent DNA helicase RecQ
MGPASARDAVPPYVVFHDRTLQELAARRPRTLAELERYGEDLLVVLDQSGS